MSGNADLNWEPWTLLGAPAAGLLVDRLAANIDADCALYDIGCNFHAWVPIAFTVVGWSVAIGSMVSTNDDERVLNTVIVLIASAVGALIAWWLA